MGQPPPDSTEHGCTDVVQPLHVIDRQQYRSCAGSRGHQIQHSHRQLHRRHRRAQVGAGHRCQRRTVPIIEICQDILQRGHQLR